MSAPIEQTPLQQNCKRGSTTEALTKDGYKHTKLGWIPQDWQITSLGNCTKYIKGFAFKSKNYCDEGVRIVRVSDTDANSIKSGNNVFIDKKEFSKYSKWKLKMGDLIFTTVGSRPPLYDSMVGKVIPVREENAGSLLNQNAVIIREDGVLIQNLLIYFFKQKRYLNHIESIVRGNANQVSITLKELFEFVLPVPPLPEQQQIARILSTWDRAIALQQQLIAAKQQLKKGLMQVLLTGKVRFDGFDGEWEEKKLSSIGKIITGNTPSTKNPDYYGFDYLFVSPVDINEKKTVINTEKKLTLFGFESGRFISKGSVLFVCIGSTIGKTAIAGEDLITNQQINSIITNDKNDSSFLYYQLSFQNKKISLLAGNQAVPIINKTTFSKIKLHIPKLQEQQKIATVLSAVDKEIDLLNIQLDQLKAQKKGLMQQLLSGIVRVNVNIN